MFNEKLKQAMQEKEMNIPASSAVTGIGRNSISQYLSGKNEPTDRKKEIFAVALGFAPDYFKREAVKETITLETPNLPAMTAARLMGRSKGFIYQGLRDGKFPWGYGVKMGENWSYYISPAMFEKRTGLTV